jgi:hypothetical protein
VLFPEFCARVWRKASAGELFIGPDVDRRFYMSSDPVSDVLNPQVIADAIRGKQIAAAIPLNQIVAITTPIDAGAYIAFYLTDESTEYTMRRVGEGAEVPTARLTGGDHAIRVRKYGRRLLGTYETFRRMPLDRFALHLGLLAVKTEADKVTTALDVIENGDGNAGTTPTSYNLTALDGDAVAGTMTTTGFLAWKMKWTSPYYLTTVLTREGDALQLLQLQLANALPFWAFPAGTFGQVKVINNGFNSGVGLGWMDTITNRYLVGIDNRFAIEMVVEAGASLTETNKIISTQFNELVITESLAFCVLDANANKRMNVNA